MRVTHFKITYYQILLNPERNGEGKTTNGKQTMDKL